MRRTLALLARNGAATRPNLIQIRGGTFYKEHPAPDGSDAVSNPALFRNLTFELPATRVTDIWKRNRQDNHWAVISANDGTTFLEILRGNHLCFPPNARTFPYLSSDEIDKRDHRLRAPSRAIQYVGFNAGKGQSMGGGVRGAYLSARYEARREETDWSLLQYLTGQTELNPAEDAERSNADNPLLQQVITDLRLQKLLHMPVSNLSNGQTRRSRIAKALLNKPELLLLDEPFSESTFSIRKVVLTRYSGPRSAYAGHIVTYPARACISLIAPTSASAPTSRSHSRMDHPSGNSRPESYCGIEGAKGRSTVQSTQMGSRLGRPEQEGCGINRWTHGRRYDTDMRPSPYVSRRHAERTGSSQLLCTHFFGSKPGEFLHSRVVSQAAE